MAQVDIDGIKSAIKTILDAANTTTGSPIDLSSGMASRVQRVLMVHPNRIQIQPSHFPFISIYARDKSIEQQTIGHKGNQTSALRKAVLQLDIFAACYEPFFSNVNEDQGAENTEQLLENIEEVLRSNVTINGTCHWAIPSRSQFDEIPWDEEAHLRAGILTYDVTVFY
jgi:hypothetical protein